MLKKEGMILDHLFLVIFIISLKGIGLYKRKQIIYIPKDEEIISKLYVFCAENSGG